MGSYANQVVLITGVANGIGRQLAIEFARRGAAVAGIDLTTWDRSLLEEMKRVGPGAGTFAFEPADVSNRGAMGEAVRKLEFALGPADIVIANAGIGEENPIVGFDADLFARMVEVNLIGVANTLEPVLPGMIDRRRGHIIALSSLASYRGLPLMAGYCASKAGVTLFLDSLRVELQQYRIQCTTICPGFIRTNMTKNAGVPMPGILSLERAVARMMRGIERKQPYLAFPAQNRFLLALNRLLPTSWGDYLTLKVMGAALRKRMNHTAAPAKV